MPKLPVISGKEAVKALSKAGFYIHHQKGSHIVLRNEELSDMRVCCAQSQRIKKGYVKINYQRFRLNCR